MCHLNESYCMNVSSHPKSLWAQGFTPTRVQERRTILLRESNRKYLAVIELLAQEKLVRGFTMEMVVIRNKLQGKELKIQHMR